MVWPQDISSLSRSCSPHLEHLSIICRPFYLPRRVLRGHRYLPFTSHHRQTRAWLCLNFTMWSAATLTTSRRCFYHRGDFNKANLRQVMPNFHQHVSCPTRGPNTLDHCYSQLRTPTRPVHYLPLVSLTTPPSSSHRNTNKGSHRNPGEEGSDALVLPLWSYAAVGSWWRRLGHVQGELIWRQRVHGGGSELCKHTYRNKLQKQ